MKTQVKFFTAIVFSMCLTFAIGDIQPLRAGLREELGLVALWTLDGETIKGNTVEDKSGEFFGTITGNPKVIPDEITDNPRFRDNVKRANPNKP